MEPHIAESNIRVYYQNDDGTIRETYFNDKEKWFSTGTVVTTLAKPNSPIVATRWVNGNEVQIRVYYIGSNGSTGECVGTSQSNSATIWTVGGDLKAAAVAPASQLGIARPGNNDSTLRVYYQEAKTNNIREIMYYDDQASWSVSDIAIPGAMEGTRISAISAKPPGDVRLYFQGSDPNNPLKEWFMNQNSLYWSQTNLRSFPLTPKAPITAICWYGNMSDPNNPKDLRIRVFTVTKAVPGQISQLFYNQTQGWSGNPTSLVDVYRTANGSQTSAVGICQIPGNSTGAISVFFQPNAKVIDLRPVPMGSGTTGAAEVAAVVLPRGIPISL